MSPPRAKEERTSSPRVAFLLKRSAWRVFVEERSDARLRSLLKRKDPTVARLRAAHDSHERAVDEVLSALQSIGAKTTEISDSPGELRQKKFDLVITVGGDGTLLRASHHVLDVPILGINSAPDSSVGFFCAGHVGASRTAIVGALDGSLPRTVLTRMSVKVNGRSVAGRVLNDALFCHASPAATSRYIVELTPKGSETQIVEEHKSSGFWIGPAAGSTAAQRSAGGHVLPLTSEDLQLVVREPYTPLGEQHQIRRALIQPGETLLVRNKMREGAMFFDGPEETVRLAFGDIVTFTRAENSLTLIGVSPQGRMAQQKRGRW